jgi:hypothetical protein
MVVLDIVHGCTSGHLGVTRASSHREKRGCTRCNYRSTQTETTSHRQTPGSYITGQTPTKHPIPDSRSPAPTTPSSRLCRVPNARPASQSATLRPLKVMKNVDREMMVSDIILSPRAPPNRRGTPPGGPKRRQQKRVDKKRWFFPHRRSPPQSEVRRRASWRGSTRN